MITVGQRRRNQPPPPHVVAASLAAPLAAVTRPWLNLLDDEQPPRVILAVMGVVEWSSLWPRQPEAVIRFELAPDGRGGTDLCWALLVAERPDASRLGHYRRRLNELVNRDLRLSYGQ